jgi:hypothetical protein
MADEYVKETDKNDRDKPVPPPTKRIENVAGQIQNDKLEPTFSIEDRSTVAHHITPSADQKIDPEFYNALNSLEHGLVALGKSQNTDLNDPLIKRVCGMMIEVAEQAASIDPMPDAIRTKLESCSGRFADLSGKYMDRIEKGLSPMLGAQPNKDDERRLNEFGGILASLNQAATVLMNNAGTFKFSSNTFIRLQGLVDRTRHLDEQILHIATKKGYDIKSLDDALKMAEEEGNDYLFSISDVAQEKLISAMKEECTQLLADVKAIIAEASDKAQTINKNSTQKLLALKQELAAFEKKFVSKLTEKRMRDKMKAEVIVLAFFLKNPSALTTKRVDEIGNEINKIKWQAYPRFT